MFLSEYSGSSPNGHSCKRTALQTTAFTKPHFSQNSHTNFVFEQSRKWSDTFSACRGCPLTRAYTVAASVSHGRLWISTLMKVDSTASSVAALSNAGVAVSSAMWVDVVGGDTLVFSFLLVLSHLICLLSQWHIKFLKPLVHSLSLWNNRSYLWTEG